MLLPRSIRHPGALPPYYGLFQFYVATGTSSGGRAKPR